MRLSMNTRYAVIHASFWGAYGSLWAFIALVLEYNGFASAQVGVVTSCATLLSVFLSPAVSSFLDARPGLENRHGAMALLTLAAALCLIVWLVPLPRPFVLGACFALTLLGCMFFFLTHTISNTYMNALVAKAGGTASAVGTSLAISAVLELPAMTLVSRLQKRFSPGFFLRFAAGAEVVKFLIFYLARSMPLIYLGQCMQFFQFAVYAPATVYYVAAALPERDQLKGQSLIYVAGSGLGGALGNLLGGRLLDRSGIQAALLLGTVSAAASLLTFCLSTRENSR